MKKFVKVLFAFMFIAFVGVALVACSNNETPNPDDKTTEINISSNELSIELEINGTKKLAYSLDGATEVEIRVKDSDVVKVENGVATGLKEGTTEVYVSVKDHADKQITFTVRVKGAAKQKYTVSYDLDGGCATGLVEEFEENSFPQLVTPTKEGFNFLGWFDGETKVEAINENKNYSLKAKWEAIEVKYTISYDLDGGEATGLVEEFVENDFPQLVTPTKEGFDFLGWYDGETKVEAISENKDYALKAKWEEVSQEILPESIEITISCDDEIIYLDTECVITCKVLPEGASQEVEWKNMNRSKATLNEDGTINLISGREATFKATSAADPDVTASITIKFRMYPDPDKYIESLQVKSEDIVAQKVKLYTSTQGSDGSIKGSVIRLLFEDINIKENWVPEGQHNRPGKYTDEGVLFHPYFICVHDVGAPGDATSNSNYCKSPGAGNYLSWHFTVGNDGLYQQLPLDEIGYHAGDGTHYNYQFHDSGILAPEGDFNPAVITVNQVTGKYMIGGQDTKITAPLNGAGRICTNDQLPYTGINNYVDDDPNSPTYRHYMIGDTWWSSGYATLSNLGGNVNSIGIETQVTANTFYTWERTAKLIGSKLLPELNLTIKDIKQHNTFSGKDCPMTMRHANRWETFLEYCQAEYYLAIYYYNYKITFETDSPYLSENGMIKTLPAEATEVSYKVRFYSEVDGYDKTFEYKVTLPSKSVIAY